MKSHLLLSSWLGAAALAAGACVSLSDLPRSDSGAESSADETPEVTEEDSGDGPRVVNEADAGAPREPVGWVHPPMFLDASVDANVGPIPEPTQCTQSSDCAADQVCDRAQCIARCTAYGACVAFEAERAIRGMYSVGDTVYWLVDSSTDSLGNSRKDAELWRKDPDVDPVRILKGLLPSTEFVFKNGYVYFQQVTSLQRAPLQADASAERLYDLPSMNWTVGDSFVAFDTPDGIDVGSLDGTAAVRSFFVAGDPKLLVNLVANGDIIYFKRELEQKVSSVRVVEPYIGHTTAAVLPISSTTPVRGSVLYAWYGIGGSPQSLHGEDTNDGSSFTAAKFDPTFSDPPNSSAALIEVVAGDWAYMGVWETVNKGNNQLTRFSLAHVGSSQVIIPTGTLGDVTPLSVTATSSKLFFTSHYDSRLVYELALPPDTCTPDLPCATQ